MCVRGDSEDSEGGSQLPPAPRPGWRPGARARVLHATSAFSSDIAIPVLGSHAKCVQTEQFPHLYWGATAPVTARGCDPSSLADNSPDTTAAPPITPTPTTRRPTAPHHTHGRCPTFTTALVCAHAPPLHTGTLTAVEPYCCSHDGEWDVRHIAARGTCARGSRGTGSVWAPRSQRPTTPLATTTNTTTTAPITTATTTTTHTRTRTPTRTSFPAVKQVPRPQP